MSIFIHGGFEVLTPNPYGGAWGADFTILQKLNMNPNKSARFVSCLCSGDDIFLLLYYGELKRKKMIIICIQINFGHIKLGLCEFVFNPS